MKNLVSKMLWGKFKTTPAFLILNILNEKVSRTFNCRNLQLYLTYIPHSILRKILNLAYSYLTIRTGPNRKYYVYPAILFCHLTSTAVEWPMINDVLYGCFGCGWSPGIPRVWERKKGVRIRCGDLITWNMISHLGRRSLARRVYVVDRTALPGFGWILDPTGNRTAVIIVLSSTTRREIGALNHEYSGFQLDNRYLQVFLFFFDRIWKDLFFGFVRLCSLNEE